MCYHTPEPLAGWRRDVTRYHQNQESPTYNTRWSCRLQPLSLQSSSCLFLSQQQTLSLQVRTPLNIFILAIADVISLQGVALPSVLSALAHFSAAASQWLGAMDLLVLQARRPVNGLELRGDGVRVGSVHFGRVKVEVVKKREQSIEFATCSRAKEARNSSQEFQDISYRPDTESDRKFH